MMTIAFEHVSYIYPAAKTPALHDISLTIDAEKLTGVCGMSGSGKTTFIRHFNGILKPTFGRVLLDGDDIHQSKDSLRRARQRIGMTFQFPERQLFGRTVWEELSYTLERRHLSQPEITQRIETACDLLKFDLARLRNVSPFALNQGMQRKLGIALILALQPELIVLDEPTAGMDRGNAQKLLDVLHTLHQRAECRVLLVSHNLELLLDYAEHLILLGNGKDVFSGTPQAILTTAAQSESCGIELPAVNRTLALLRQHDPSINPAATSVRAALEEVRQSIPRETPCI